MNTFEAFLLAYAEGARDAALYLWDEYHNEWSIPNNQVANTIIVQIDQVGGTMASSNFNAWYNRFVQKAKPIAETFIARTV